MTVTPRHTRTERVRLAIAHDCRCAEQIASLASLIHTRYPETDVAGVAYHRSRLAVLRSLGRDPMGNHVRDLWSDPSLRLADDHIKRVAVRAQLVWPRIGGLPVQIAVRPGHIHAEIANAATQTLNPGSGPRKALFVYLDPSWAHNVLRRRMHWAHDHNAQRWAIIDAGAVPFPSGAYAAMGLRVTSRNQCVVAVGRIESRPDRRWRFVPDAQQQGSTAGLRCPRDWNIVQELRAGAYLELEDLTSGELWCLYVPHPYPPYERFVRYVPLATMRSLEKKRYVEKVEEESRLGLKARRWRLSPRGQRKASYDE